MPANPYTPAGNPYSMGTPSRDPNVTNPEDLQYGLADDMGDGQVAPPSTQQRVQPNGAPAPGSSVNQPHGVGSAMATIGVRCMTCGRRGPVRLTTLAKMGVDGKVLTCKCGSTDLDVDDDPLSGPARKATRRKASVAFDWRERPVSDPYRSSVHGVEVGAFPGAGENDGYYVGDVSKRPSDGVIDWYVSYASPSGGEADIEDGTAGSIEEAKAKVEETIRNLVGSGLNADDLAAEGSRRRTAGWEKDDLLSGFDGKEHWRGMIEGFPVSVHPWNGGREPGREFNWAVGDKGQGSDLAGGFASTVEDAKAAAEIAVRSLVARMGSRHTADGGGGHYSGVSFDRAVQTALQNLPIQQEVAADPKGFVIHEVGPDTYQVFDAEPQAPGGLMAPGERPGHPVATVGLDGRVTRLGRRTAADENWCYGHEGYYEYRDGQRVLVCSECGKAFSEVPGEVGPGHLPMHEAPSDRPTTSSRHSATDEDIVTTIRGVLSNDGEYGYGIPADLVAKVDDDGIKTIWTRLLHEDIEPVYFDNGQGRGGAVRMKAHDLVTDYIIGRRGSERMAAASKRLEYTIDRPGLPFPTETVANVIAVDLAKADPGEVEVVVNGRVFSVYYSEDTATGDDGRPVRGDVTGDYSVSYKRGSEDKYLTSVHVSPHGTSGYGNSGARPYAARQVAMAICSRVAQTWEASRRRMADAGIERIKAETDPAVLRQMLKDNANLRGQGVEFDVLDRLDAQDDAARERLQAIGRRRVQATSSDVLERIRDRDPDGGSVQPTQEAYDRFEAWIRDTYGDQALRDYRGWGNEEGANDDTSAEDDIPGADFHAFGRRKIDRVVAAIRRTNRGLPLREAQRIAQRTLAKVRQHTAFAEDDEDPLDPNAGWPGADEDGYEDGYLWGLAGNTEMNGSGQNAAYDRAAQQGIADANAGRPPRIRTPRIEERLGRRRGHRR